ncbi:MAG: FAD-binding oxidoreductase [Acidobacteriota bacterium]
MQIAKTRSTESAHTAIVIGGGIVGLACALQLQRRGMDTLLVEPLAATRAASWGNAGHLAIEQVEPLASRRTLRSFPRRLFSRGGALSLPPGQIATWLPFAWRLSRAASPTRFESGKAALAKLLRESIPAWRRLGSLADAADLIADDGHFIVWETAAGARAGRAQWASTETGEARFRDLTSQESKDLCAMLPRTFADAVRFVGPGRVRDPGELIDRLQAMFVSAGGERRIARAQSLKVDGAAASCVLQNGETIRADTIVVSAGVGSRALLEPIGHRVPIIAERGYHLQAKQCDWPDTPPVVFEERSMIVSRFRSGLRAASFVEFSSENAAPDPRKWQRLRSHVDALGLPFQGACTEWMGARPTLPDYLPAIGRSARAGNLWYAFGHQHLGLTLAAVTGELIGSLATGETPTVDTAAFDVDRF